MIKACLAALFLVSFSASAMPKWFDQSHEIFLTKELDTMASNYRDFPLFWWNFLIIDGTTNWDDLSALCADIATSSANLVQKVPCHFDVKQLGDFTHDWLRDLPLREAFPGDKVLHTRMQETLAKASLPMGRDVLEVLRLDPLGTLNDLKERVEKRMQMDLKLEHGFLVDEKSHRVLMPIQFSFSPADSAQTHEFTSTLADRCQHLKGCTGMDLFGPHASTRENEMRIRDDVSVVSLVGPLAMALLCLFIFVTRRYRILNLVPILLFTIAFDIVVTVLVFGKIHGITLGFGPGIVGLAMDYGIHSCFLGPRSAKTWRANWVGLLTTIVIMIILGFSSIPLLRQMMFFSVFGLCFNYLLIYMILRRWPEKFEADHYQFSPAQLPWLKPVAIVLLVLSAAIFTQRVHLDVGHLNYESPRTQEMRQWFFKVAGTDSPYLVIEDERNALASSESHKKWADEHGIQFEGLSNYIPSFNDQTRHVLTWRAKFCDGNKPKLTEQQTKFFAPFLKSIDCDKLYADPLNSAPPDYLQDFAHEGRYVGLFFPKTPEQIQTLHAQYSEATTPREIFDSFPRIFYNELLWMVPLAFAGAFLFLYLHYLQLGWSALAVVPFLTGLGLYAAIVIVFHLPISFISLIGLLMVFGCSLDYGVFVMDFLLFRKEDQRGAGVWSALSLCAFATIAGFAPLVFAHHPVLNDLGQALLWGTLGTYIGSLWGITGVYTFWQKWRARA